MTGTDRRAPGGGAGERRVVAFVEAVQEWAELPREVDEVAWCAAVAFEAAFGIWRGHAVRILELCGRRITDDLWRDRSRDIDERVTELAARPRTPAHASADTTAAAPPTVLPSTPPPAPPATTPGPDTPPRPKPRRHSSRG